jgi:hypothetical protein
VKSSTLGDVCGKKSMSSPAPPFGAYRACHLGPAHMPSSASTENRLAVRMVRALQAGLLARQQRRERPALRMPAHRQSVRPAGGVRGGRVAADSSGARRRREDGNARKVEEAGCGRHFPDDAISLMRICLTSVVAFAPR